MSIPEGWTPEEAARLGAVGRGECTHENVMVVRSVSYRLGEVRWAVCTQCYSRVDVPEDVDE